MSLLVLRGLVNGTEFLEDRKRSSWRRSFLSHIPARMGAARRANQWVGTTSRAPPGGRVPSWGNLITFTN